MLAACGGDEGGGTPAGGEETGATKGAKAVEVAGLENAKGDVTYCAGKDTSGDLKEGIENFNKENP
ncbi:MAG TPA: hypothetical protein VM266_03160, partial [Solirubrobacteraceae bacterium]|nr:hypothetical protein [Solirubrobacteraceae bacterium]